MSRPSRSHTALSDALWFRWFLILVGIVVWLGIMREFPLYFQRDDVQWMDWANRRSITDSFVPMPGYGFSIDAAFRPLISCYWWILYRTFGLQFNAYYLLTGLLFILTLALLFKLVAKVSSNRSAYFSVLVWFAAFQFLMTVLFWLSDHVYLLMTTMVLGGLYGLVTGLGSSTLRVTLSLIVLLASLLVWESLALIAWTAVAVLISTRGGLLGWKARKTAVYAALAFLVGPAYWIGLPFGRHRFGGSGESLVPTFADVSGRFSYYAGYLLSGITGIVLLVPAVYWIMSYLMRKAGVRAETRVPLSLIAALALSAALVKMHALVLGFTVLLLPWLLLPRTVYLFLPVICVPAAGLLIFAEPSRTYLFLPSYALAALAGIELNGLYGDVRDWWTAKIRRQAITYAVIAAVIALATVPVARKLRTHADLLRLRSDVTQNLRMMTSRLRALPQGAVVLVVDYAAMGIRFREGMLRWTDREKLLHQAPVDSTKAQFWFNDIGRSDLKMIKFSDYAGNPQLRPPGSEVYVWLQTVKDHEFFAKRGLKTDPIARLKRGDAVMSLLRLK